MAGEKKKSKSCSVLTVSFPNSPSYQGLPGLDFIPGAMSRRGVGHSRSCPLEVLMTIAKFHDKKEGKGETKILFKSIFSDVCCDS